MSDDESTARYLPLRDYLTLKAAVRRLVRICGGPHAAAAITRSDTSRLSRFGAPSEAMQAPVDVIADLEAEAGAPLVTRALADLSGYLLVPVPAAAAGEIGPGELGALAKEAGEAISRLGEALAGDGRVSAAEIRRLNLRSEIRDALEILARIDESLKVKEAEEG